MISERTTAERIEALSNATVDLEGIAHRYVKTAIASAGSELPKARAELRESAVNFTIALLDSLGIADKLTREDIERLTDAAGLS